MVESKETSLTVAQCVQRHEEACQELNKIMSILASNENASDIHSVPNLIQKASNPILAIKAYQRTACLLLEQKMEEAISKKSQVQTDRVALRNLVYEKDHLKNEISNCKDYSTQCLDSMVKSTISAKKELSKEGKQQGTDMAGKETDSIKEDIDMSKFSDPNEHSSNLKELNFQISERVRLVKQLESSQDELSKLQKQTQKKQNFSKDLLRKIDMIEKATYPLQNYFTNGFSHAKTLSYTPTMAMGSTFHAIAMAGNNSKQSNVFSKSNSSMMGELSSQRKRYERASKLPTSLYTLCCQLEALADTTEQQRKHEEQSVGNEINLDANEMFLLQNISISVDVTASKSYISKTDSPDSSSTNDEAFFYETDPSSVLLHFNLLESTVSTKNTSDGSKTKALALKPSSTTTTIRFQYLTNLNIITAVMEPNTFDKSPSNRMLSNLFPGDHGHVSPNATNQFLICPQSGNTLSEFSVSQCMNARPYLWVQWLAGLNFLPPSSYSSKAVSSQKDGSERVAKKQKQNPLVEPRTTASIVRQLKRRIYSHSALERLLSKLQKTPTPVPIHPSLDSSVFPIASSVSPGRSKYGKGSFHLSSWKKIQTTDEIFKNFQNQFPLEGHHSSTDQNRYFMAMLQHSNMTIEAMVEITPEYPVRAPRWRLQHPIQAQPPANQDYSSYTSHTKLLDNNLKAIEHRVNVDYAMELVNKDRLEETFAWVLIHQLRMIMACCDASQLGKNDRGNTLVTQRTKRGRDRRSIRAFERYARGL